MLENHVAETASRVDAAVHGPLGGLLQFTAQLFGGQPFVRESSDPEFPADRYLVIVAPTTLSPQAIVAAEQKWIAACRDLAPGIDSLRLSTRPA